MVVTYKQGRQNYHVGEKPTVILYTYITTRHAGTWHQKQRIDTMNLDTAQLFPMDVSTIISSCYDFISYEANYRFWQGKRQGLAFW